MPIEIPEELAAAGAEIARTTGQDVQSLVNEMVTEAIKMRRVSGIVFADGATGRRACVPGTGIPVWEIIEYYEFVERDFEKLHRGFDWIEKHRLEVALAYYNAFPEEIRPHLKTEEEALAQLHELWEKYPQTRPQWRGRQCKVPSGSGGTSRESA
jgi:uncharacterized protein (DUF433 family)